MDGRVNVFKPCIRMEMLIQGFAMFLLRALTTLFLLPGTLVLSLFNISVEDDGGIFRSLINMLFWGFIGALVVLMFLLK